MDRPTDLPNIPIDSSAIKALQDLKDREARGELLDVNSKNALKALGMASQIIETIMNGGQVDPVYIKQIILNLNKSLDHHQPEVKKIKKKKKLRPNLD